MKYALILASLLLVLPSAAFAMTPDLSHLGEKIQREVQQAIQNANASGNGVSVESSVSSSGGSSASSQVTTSVVGNGGGGSVHTHIETTENGQTKVEDYNRDFAPGENVQYSSGDGSAHIDVRVQGSATGTEGWRGATSTVQASTTHATSARPWYRSVWPFGGSASTSVAASSSIDASSAPLQFVRSLLGQIFGFFRFW